MINGKLYNHLFDVTGVTGINTERKIMPDIETNEIQNENMESAVILRGTLPNRPTAHGG